MTETVGVILRLSGVAVSQDVLKEALGFPVSLGRGRRTGDDDLYASIELTEEDEKLDWDALLTKLDRLVEPLSVLVKEGAVAQEPKLDIGLPFYTGAMGAWVMLPPEICALAGRNGIAIIISYYLTQEDDDAG
ncbi:hypothetical protein [Rhizobium oryzicola]|uniref:DUF4279 domain-containing protein n=1 Tax=Rhizobium oryzicola TaxID=1232668 RepID=A0ABT8ST39_9HYPH|nr:hypothetical protein [Rhizobium oryzicola]MDO1581561.1 hypothetical protein [Rhizobium oryzicola]